MRADELRTIVERLRRLGRDDAQYEVKAAAKELPKGIWESVSAFANTTGGTLILGLDEGTGFRPAPGFDHGRIEDQLRSGLDTAPQATAKVRPVPPFEVETHILDGAPVVVVTVSTLREDPGAQLPCFVTDRGVQNGSFKRIGDADKKLDAYEIYNLQTRFTEDITDREPVHGATSSDLDPDLLRRMLAGLRRRSRALAGIDPTDTIGGLARINVVDGAGVPTLAGLLALGTYPQREYPQLTVDVAVHPGPEKSADLTVRFLDRRICDGPIPVMIDDAVSAVLRHLAVRRVIVGTEGVDEPEIPELVLREAITNAVIHRDYSARVRGQQVAVDVYPDRVEVTSPGGFRGDRTVDNVGEGRSTSRNASLSRILMDVPLPGSDAYVVENQGTGVPMMNQAMQARGLRAPDYSRSTLSRVVVRLHRRPDSDSTDHRTLTPVQDLVLAILDRRTPQTIAQLAEATGKSRIALRPVLRELIERGCITATAPPQSRRRAYLLADR